MGRNLYDSPTSSIQLLDEVPMVHGAATPRILPEYSTPTAASHILPETPGVRGVIPLKTLDPTIPKGLLDEFEQLGFYGVAPQQSRLASRIPLMPSESGYFVPTNRVSNG